MEPAAAAATVAEMALRPKLHALSSAIARQDAELRELASEVAAAAPDVSVMVDENTQLARHAEQAVEEASAMRSKHDRLKQETHEYWQRVHSLQAECDLLRTRLGDVQRSEVAAVNAAELTSRVLAIERDRGAAWDRSLEQEMERQNHRIREGEAHAAAAEQSVQRAEVTLRGVGDEASTAARAAAVDAERMQSQASELEAQLQDLQRRARIRVEHERAARREVAEAQAEVASRRASTHHLAEELTESERRTQQTERKALGVARELYDTSQLLAKLRSELMAQEFLQREVMDACREEGQLEQHFAEMRSAMAGAGGDDGRAVQAQPAAAMAIAEARAASAPTSPAAADLDVSLPAGLGLQDLHLARSRAATAALYNAWEAEAREYRATEQQLEAMQKLWPSLREWLARLAIAAERQRDELLASSQDVAASEGHHLPELWIPEVQDSFAGDDDLLLPSDGAVRALSDFVEALARESLRRLHATASAGGAPSASGGGAAVFRGAGRGRPPTVSRRRSGSSNAATAAAAAAAAAAGIDMSIGAYEDALAMGAVSSLSGSSLR